MACNGKHRVGTKDMATKKYTAKKKPKKTIRKKTYTAKKKKSY